MPTGLGGEQLWISATNDNTGTSTAFNDQSGTGNNGTAIGTTVVADTSEGGTYAFDFDGAGDYIDIQGLSGQYPLGGSYSTSLWVNNDVTNIDQLYFSRYETDGASGSNDQRPEILMSDDTGLRTRALYKVGTGTVGLNANSTYQGGVWYHIASTYDSATNTMTLYKNGVSVGSVVTASDSDWETNYAEIGRASISGGATQVYSDCKLDDIRSFTRVLTQAEIIHLASSRGIEGPPPEGLGDEQLWLCPSIANTAFDISGNGNSGTYQGGMGTVADTSNGGTYAYSFDGVDDWIECSGPIGNSGAFSLSMWANRSSSISPTTTLAAQYDISASNRYWYIQQKTFSSGNAFGTYPTASTTTGRVDSESTFTPNTGTWYHITALYDPSAGEQRLYIDGALADTDVSTGFQSSTIGLSLGSLDGVQNWNGKLDDVRQYSRALTQAEITHLATSRGIEGGPSSGGFYNPFKSHTFHTLTGKRIR